MTGLRPHSYDSVVTLDGNDDAADLADARYQIGEVAQRTGVTQRTLRFYEEKELLRPSERMQGGFRLYSEADIRRIEFIKQLQNLLGLSLAEIKEMVDAEAVLQQIRATFRPDRDPKARVKRLDTVRSALHLQREIVEHHIERLVDMKAEIGERLEAVERYAREMEEKITTGTTRTTKQPKSSEQPEQPEQPE